jgi:hypothetical protein
MAKSIKDIFDQSFNALDQESQEALKGLANMTLAQTFELLSDRAFLKEAVETCTNSFIEGLFADRGNKTASAPTPAQNTEQEQFAQFLESLGFDETMARRYTNR